jgi:hypothetical protein
LASPLSLTYRNPSTYSTAETFSGFTPSTATGYDSGFYDSGLPYDGIYNLYFFTPVVGDEPPFLADSSAVQIGLWRHNSPGIRGVNVFLLSDGTYAQDTATAENQNVSVPYPINFSYPGDPIVSTTNWDGSVIETYINPYVVRQYFGGTYNGPLANEEITALSAAGYGGCLVDAP